jgi:hypothetical protein
MKITDKMPNALYFYEGLTQEEIGSIVVQKYVDSETGIVGTISEVEEFKNKIHTPMGMTF